MNVYKKAAMAHGPAAGRGNSGRPTGSLRFPCVRKRLPSEVMETRENRSHQTAVKRMVKKVVDNEKKTN